MKAGLIIFLMLLLATAVSAQITIHNTDFSPIGYSYTWGTADQATFSPGSAGANQTWTFGSFTWSSGEQRTYVNPSTAPHSSDFPGATRAEHIAINFGPETESYSFAQITASAYTLLGQVAGDSVMVFNPAMIAAPLPCTYGQSWHTVMRFSMHFDTIAATFQDSLTYNVDGWGTVNTPYGSWPVLRMFIHHWITVYVMGFPMTSYEELGYTFVNQQGNSVVTLSSDQGATDPNFTTGAIAMMGVPLSAKPQRGPVAESFKVGQNYPNPFNPTTEIPVTLSKDSRVSLDVYDELGQLVSHSEQMLPAGSHQMNVDGSRWSTGMYFARISAGAEQRVLKMNLLK